MLTPLLLGLAAATATTAPSAWQLRGAVGGQLDSAPHGVLDLGVTSGPWSLQLFTDTLDLRFDDRGDDGRWWIGARGEVGAAGLFISRWTAGAPDPSRSLLAFYGSLDAGWLRYLGRGTYAGVEGTVRRWFFRATSDTRIALPDEAWVLSPGLVAGIWAPAAEASLHVGLDRHGSTTSPKLWAEAKVHPELEVGPLIEARAGWTADASDLTTTRVGGLNPYVVPVAGMGWAEWWVERYVGVRAGPRVRWPNGHLTAVFDGVRTEIGKAWGLGLLGHQELGRYFLDLHLGWAPDVARTAGTLRVSAWILLGVDALDL